ncbi:phosphoesterase family-domain-containing protein [Bombardia bombarda]|uniref:acid phosphatase n=1 Tax=Bombardia bombarda TaxID=252184 RepID=A0AA39X816_9PEZI|nr:phosphoesterase family-domain-containing protein [Bombardia bombarda]
MALVATGVAASSFQPTAYATTRAPLSTIQPSLASIFAAQATAVPSSPTSDVKGAAFDRIVQIWLENQDYESCFNDTNMEWIASHGILLTNYFAVTHPSQPNYAAAVGGDTFGMDHDEFERLPANISTVVDLLDTKGISWGEYQEHQPYAGFQGMNFSNQDNYEDDYVRKHNPLVLFDSVANNASRVQQIKNFTSFYDDLKAEKLPQWSFLTPNMTNDAHDTNITFSAKWTRSFVEPLLANPYFMKNTLLIVTFDENEVYTTDNRVFTVLLGGAIPKSLHGTVDAMYYNLYSTLSTVSVNWDLPSLGRWDCDANVLQLVANKTGYANTNISVDGLYFNETYPGATGNFKHTPGFWPAPNTQAKCASGRGVLQGVVDVWGNTTGTYNYTNVYPYNEVAGIVTGGKPVKGLYSIISYDKVSWHQMRELCLRNPICPFNHDSVDSA